MLTLEITLRCLKSLIWKQIYFRSLRILDVKFQQMLDTNFRDVPNFIKTSLSGIKNSHLKSTHGVLSEVSKNKLSDFMFGQYYLQTIDFIESNIYKLFAQQTRTKTPENLCSIFFR